MSEENNQPRSSERHAEPVQTFQQAAMMMKSLAREPAANLDPEVKAAQKKQLVALVNPPTEIVAAPLQKIEVLPTPEAQMPPLKHGARRWLWLGGAFTALTAVAVFVLFIQTNFGGRFLNSNQSALNQVVRLIVPEAQAADAFTLVPDKADAAGMTVDSGITIKSAIPVTANQLMAALQITPAVEYDLKQISTQDFRIQPTQPLLAGTVYKVTLAAQVNQTDGRTRLRDFSWALQTKDVWQVVSTLPADGSSDVPVNTGIEFKFSADGWADPTTAFSITPAASGRFENHGRSLTFVPDKTLQTGQRYEIVLSKDLARSNSDVKLGQDIKIRFETSPNQAVYSQPGFSLSEFVEREPGVPVSLSMNVWGADYTDQPFDVSVYQLNHDQAKNLISQRAALPEWAPQAKSRFDEYKNLTQNRVFELTQPLQRHDQNGFWQLNLPKFDAPGWYVGHLSSKFAPGQEAWFMLQVTGIASYLTADENTLLVWTVNTSQPAALSNLKVNDGHQTFTTDNQGLARLKTPGFLKNSQTLALGDNQPFEILELGEGKDAAFEVVQAQPSILPFRSFWSTPGLEKTWGYVYTDRQIYRLQDALKFFGVAQDRGTRQSAGSVELRLVKANLWMDFNGNNNKAYQSVNVTPDAAGRYQGELSWSNLTPGAYQLALVRDGQIVTQRGFEVREFVKPAYFIDVLPDQHQLLAGGDIHGQLRARFYDGTPVPRASLKLVARTGAGQEETQTIVTDNSGLADFDVTTTQMSCPPMLPGPGAASDCIQQDNLTLEVRPTVGEEGEIVGTDMVQLYASNLDIGLKTSYVSSTATLSISLRHRDFSKADGLGDAWANNPIRGSVRGEYWVQIEDGTSYDFISKKTVPRYTYEKRYDPEVKFNLTSDSNGAATYAFDCPADRDCRVQLWSDDDRGRTAYWSTYVSGLGGAYYGYYEGMDTQTPKLIFKPENDFGEFAFDAPVQVEYVHGSLPLRMADVPGVLYLVASRGLKSATVAASADYSFNFTRDLSPNAVVHAVTFFNGQFESVQANASIKQSSETLTVEAKADQETYAPGANARVHVTVKDLDSKAPAVGAKVMLAAVDQALDGVMPFSDENPFSILYQFVPDGLIYERLSHLENIFGLQGRAASVADMGAGGGAAAAAAARRIFKDTASFQVVETDANGEADINFKLPDNLTSWRTEIVVVTPELKTGATRVELPVTKQVFVDAVVPPRLLVSDRPVLKLRAYGNGLTAQSPVTFTVNAPTLGLNNQTLQGTADTPMYVALEKLVAGTHVIQLGVQSTAGNDLMERQVTITTSNFLKDKLVTLDATPNATLSDVGAAETEVYFSSQERAGYLLDVQDVFYQDYARIDSRLASRLMAGLLHSAYAIDETPSGDDLSTYQAADGGIKLLPYSSSDLELSSEVAASDPSAFDRTVLSAYFYDQLDNQEANREKQLASLSGLAALGEPVLVSLKQAATFQDLNWREQLFIARGLVAAGDLEDSRGLLNALLAKATTRDGLVSLAVSDKPAEIYEATAEAAALASQLGLPSADGLRQYLDHNRSDDAFPVLARARYLLSVVPTLGSESSISWTIGNQPEQSISLKTEPTHVITLTADEAKQFKVTKVTGKVQVSFIKRAPGRPMVVPEIGITRSYHADQPLDQLNEGDLITVSLKPNWQSTAQDGCYEVRDHLPGGWQAVVKSTGDYRGDVYYPDQIQNGEVSFVACKSDWFNDHDISYLARIVSRGSYTAEAPVMQNLEFPSVAALGTDQTITAK